MIDRRFFVGEEHNTISKREAAVPIGYGFNSTKPSQVAHVLELLGTRHKVLEVGTGCGWQTALLTEQCEQVFSIEFHSKLYERAVHNLKDYPVTLKCDNGMNGWDEYAPFDGIVVCAAIENVDKLLTQLSDGGVLIAPIGNANTQQLTRYTKTTNGIMSENLGSCGFTLIKEI